jgi:hypothetical protein
VQLTLRRLENTPDGVFGKLYIPLRGVLHTMEEDWRNNQRRQSSIPAGTYKIRRTTYYKHGYPTFEVTGVPGRTRILFHPANTEEDVEGCIGLGLKRGKLRVPDEDRPGQPLAMKHAVLNSQAAFKKFMLYMTGINEAELTVEWAPGVE